MADTPSVKGFFKALITDQLISRVVETAVGVVVAGPVGAIAVPVLSKAVEYYGPTVANRVWRWINGQPAAEACATLEAVANLDARSARLVIDAVVEEIAPNAPQEAKSLAKSYLASIPATIRQTLPRTPSGKSTCPAALLPRNEQDVYRLLPTFLPPYNAPCNLPGTQYQLHELLGTGGFGAVYKATVQSEREPRALKFCLDPDRTATLKLEKDRLDRLVSQEEGRDWPANVVRLIGHNLDHETPFLIFEYVPDGDLGIHVQNLRVKHGRAMKPDEVLSLVRKLACAVQHVHAKGLTHRDLKPSNILFASQTVKIADFGMGAVVPRQNRAVSRQRSSAETTQEMRGGTWQYMSPEQRKNWKVPAHPSQDVYSLGVVWYQLLVDDFGEEPGMSLDRHLAERSVQENHCELLKECLDDRPEKRPISAAVLVERIDRIIQRVDEQERAASEKAVQQQRAREEAERRRVAQEQAERERRQQAEERQARRERAAAQAVQIGQFVGILAACCAVGAGVFALLGILVGSCVGLEWVTQNLNKTAFDGDGQRFMWNAFWGGHWCDTPLVARVEVFFGPIRGIICALLFIGVAIWTMAGMGDAAWGPGAPIPALAGVLAAALGALLLKILGFVLAWILCLPVLMLDEQAVLAEPSGMFAGCNAVLGALVGLIVGFVFASKR